MPTSPRGVRLLSGQVKRTRPYRWPTVRCGHRPLQRITCVFSVGGDALIAPWGAIPERSSKTDMAVPLATGRCGHRPYKKTCVFSVGGDALIAPRGTSPERSGKTDMAVPLALGPMWASAPTKNNVRFQRRGRCPHRPAGATSERLERTNVPLPASLRFDEGMRSYNL